MKNIPSDYKLLAEIYERYYEQFKKFSREAPERETKIYVPIDIVAIANHLKTDEYIIFGRLYTHLDKKYGYKNDDGSLSPLFSMGIGKDRNVINFPLLASVLAGLKEERNRQNLSMYLSIAAIIISFLALAVNGFKTWNDTVNKAQPQKQGCVKDQLSKPLAEGMTLSFLAKVLFVIFSSKHLTMGQKPKCRKLIFR
ncbi:MAG: hypothetical protein ABSA86_04830 [Oryzomonas sp.]